MATKKFDRTVWHGTDCDKVTSLFEYGLLVRYITKEKSWQCIYRNPHESNKFSYSWISEEDMREMFLTGWAKDDLKSFCSYVGDTWNDWLLRPVATRIYDLVSYYGAEEIFGNSYRTYTAVECQIVWKDTGDDRRTTIKLSLSINDDDNDNVFYYCNGIESLRSLVEYGVGEFIVIDCWSFFSIDNL